MASKNKRHGDVQRTEYEYLTIDGNWTYYPVAYCRWYKGVLTRGMMNTHGCCERDCKRLDKTYKFD